MTTLTCSSYRLSSQRTQIKFTKAIVPNWSGSNPLFSEDFSHGNWYQGRVIEIAYSAQGRIAHLLAPYDAAHADPVLGAWLALPAGRTEELLALGAIYLNKLRLEPGQRILQGDYLRVHLEPRRYPLPETLRFVHEEAEFVIVDKPAGLPVPSTVDNRLENIAALAARQLACPVYVTHRLDTPTSGLLLLAKTPRFQARFNKWLLERRVEKEYRAQVARPVALGSIVHYQKPDRYAPKEVSAEPREDWLRCELTVLACEPLADRYQLTLRLETGRTHQIRCQLAALGNPVLGDSLYDGRGGLPDRIELQASALTLPVPGKSWRLPTNS